MSDENESLDRIVCRLNQLNPTELKSVEQFLTTLTRPTPNEKALSDDCSFHWPHAPSHCLSSHGAYIVTAGTLHKEHHFRTTSLLDYFQSELLKKAVEYRWSIEAWACFSNHYHFVAQPTESPDSLTEFLAHLHSDTARHVNLLNNQRHRQVWHNYYETPLTFEKSYLARLHYVHQNAVHHRLVPVANQYPWCSAAWFERSATMAQVKTIYSFKTDRVKVVDSYEVVAPLECSGPAELLDAGLQGTLANDEARHRRQSSSRTR